MANAPFPVQPYLTAIAIAYRNPVLIADEVLPRVPVGVQDFKYLKHNLADGFTIPDTKVGRRGKPNEVEFQATETRGQAQATLRERLRAFCSRAAVAWGETAQARLHPARALSHRA